MSTHDEAITTAARHLHEADAVLVGASNGLSITEGLHLFAHHMIHHRPSRVMTDLLTVIGDRDAFFLTTNGEGHAQLAGFAPEQVCELEGSWRRLQCPTPCHDGLYPSWDAVAAMAAAEHDGQVPTGLLPHCPRCGEVMVVNMAADQRFVPDRASHQHLQDFLARTTGPQATHEHLVVLELGVGPRNQLVKAPLMNLVAQVPQSHYVTVNWGQVYVPPAIADRSVGIDDDLVRVMAELRAAVAARDGKA